MILSRNLCSRVERGCILKCKLNKKKIKYLERKILKIPCKYDGCKKILYTRTQSKKYCHKHAKMTHMNWHKKGKYVSNEIKSIKKRICLKCGTVFKSYGIHNRVCVGCNNSNDEIIYKVKRVTPGGYNFTTSKFGGI